MYHLWLSGHRPSKLGGYDDNDPLNRWVIGQLRSEILSVVDLVQGQVLGITGMALGVDTWGAEIFKDLEIPYICALPFKGQQSKWPRASQDRWAQALDHAEGIIIVSEGGYSGFKMQKRNEWMVDNGDEGIVVWDGTPGGTANCVNYARRNHKNYRQINPKHKM